MTTDEKHSIDRITASGKTEGLFLESSGKAIGDLRCHFAEVSLDDAHI
jgi:hypothetical protein